LDTAESRSEILRKFCNVVLEKDGEDDLGKCVKNKKYRQSRRNEI